RSLPLLARPYFTTSALCQCGHRTASTAIAFPPLGQRLLLAPPPLQSMMTASPTPINKSETLPHSGRSDRGGEQTCGPEHKELTAAPKLSPVLKSLHGKMRSADPVLTGGRPKSCGKKRVRAP